MSRKYQLIPLAHVTPGMVLSDNLLDRHGKVLLARETVLNEKMLESLRRIDIDMLPVFGEALTAEERTAQTDEQLQRLEKLFRKHNYGSSADYANEFLLESLKEYRQGAADADFSE